MNLRGIKTCNTLQWLFNYLKLRQITISEVKNFRSRLLINKMLYNNGFIQSSKMRKGVG